MCPDEERQAKPGHAGRAHGMDGDEEIEAGEDRRETINKNADDGGRDCGIRIDATEWSVKGPAGVEAAGGEGIEHEASANDVDVPAQEINFGEREIFRPDHDWQEEVAKD